MLRYRHYLTAILIIISILNNVDSMAFGVAMQDIKRDLHVGDTQLGLLTGISFAINSVVGIAIARWADRGNRITLLTITTAVWSVLVTFCGKAGNFSQLLLIRAGVAAGGAGCTPTAQSLIADHYSRPDRPRANAIYLMGLSVGPLLGLGLGGWLNDLYGWRSMFMMLGLPGAVVAVVVLLTLTEPRLKMTSQVGWAVDPEPVSGKTSPKELAPSNLKEVALKLWRTSTVRHLLWSLTVISFFTPTGPWLVAFFVRSYDVKTAELGTWFAITTGVGGMLGSYLGGAAASRYARNNERLQMKAAAFINVASAGCGILLYFTHSSFVAYALLGLTCFLGSASIGPVWATIQTLVGEHMRATAMALVSLFAGLIGGGLGPLVTGVLSDALQRLMGNESLRYTLLALSPGVLWASWHFLQASTTVTRDLNATHRGFDGAASAESLPIKDGAISL